MSKDDFIKLVLKELANFLLSHGTASDAYDALRQIELGIHKIEDEETRNLFPF